MVQNFPVKDEKTNCQFGFVWINTGDEAILIRDDNETTQAPVWFIEELIAIATRDRTEEAVDDKVTDDLALLRKKGFITSSETITELESPPDVRIRAKAILTGGLLVAGCVMTWISMQTQPLASAGLTEWVVVLLLFTTTTYLHELGHKMACEPYFSPSVSVTLIHYVFPVAVTKTNLAWAFPKSRRIWVNLAGPAVDSLLLASIGLINIIVGFNTILSAFMFTIVFRLAFSLNPVIMTDGYWLLVDIFDRPNLRTRGKKDFFNRALSVDSVYYGASVLFIWVAGIYLIVVIGGVITQSIHHLQM